MKKEEEAPKKLNNQQLLALRKEISRIKRVLKQNEKKTFKNKKLILKENLRDQVLLLFILFFAIVYSIAQVI
jgi:hypothetical protein